MNILINLDQLFQANANVSPFNLFIHYAHLCGQIVVCHFLLHDLVLMTAHNVTH